MNAGDSAPGPVANLDANGERDAFRRLQARLQVMYRAVFSDDDMPRSVIVLPSFSLDADVMAKILGVQHYEERMLCLLLLLRLPRTNVIYVSSDPISESVVDYYLHLLPGVPVRHARRRLTLISCHDTSPKPLSTKILERPRLVERILEAIPDRAAAHMTCFNVSAEERRLAVRLGVPIYGCDPDLLHLGSKSGARALFREAGMLIPDGFENLSDAQQLTEALVELKAAKPALERAVVKLNEGFSGEGNAVFSFEGAPQGADLKPWVRARLSQMGFEAAGMTWGLFESKIEAMGAIVETFIEGGRKRSPSSQYRVDPTGRLETISTHDQVLGGSANQIFLGCRFPADEAYRLAIQEEGLKAARLLRDRGVIGRFGVDFISVPGQDGWAHYAIEVNLRKGGTTHPYLMLQFLTDGHYDAATGLYRSPGGRPCFYYASDNIQNERYRGLTPDDLIDIAVLNGLHFHGTTQEGVVFHMIGALSQYGKLGMVCVAETPERARRLYDEAIAVLDRETR